MQLIVHGDKTETDSGVMLTLNSEVGETDVLSNVGAAMNVLSHANCSSLQALVKALPNALLRQYEYEDPKIKDGKHLMHSAYFKVLIYIPIDFFRMLFGA